MNCVIHITDKKDQTLTLNVSDEVWARRIFQAIKAHASVTDWPTPKLMTITEIEAEFETLKH